MTDFVPNAASADAPAAPKAATRVLIAEDERHLGVLLEHFLAARGHHVVVVPDGREALARIRAGAFEVALLDVQMPGLDGLAVLRAVRELPLPPEVIVMTGNGTVDTAITAMQTGAYDYVAKPYRMAEVDLLVRRAAERRRLTCELAATAAAGADGEMITRFAPLRAVLALVDRSAASTRGMLVRGEPGTGRSTLARRVHARAGGGPFATISCAAVARGEIDERTILRSIAAAGGGSLYLRAVELLPPAVQQTIVRSVAAEQGAPARVLASTARPLDRLALDSALRDRLDGVTIELPPLRERAGDVAALVEHFVRQVGGESPPVVTLDALALLDRQPWPGNVAELRLVLEGAVARAVDGVIEPRLFLLHIDSRSAS